MPGLRREARTASSARAAGSACTNRMDGLAVAAPNSPATITQPRKKILIAVPFSLAQEAPDQPGRQEAVVEALVGGKHLG